MDQTETKRVGPFILIKRSQILMIFLSNDEQHEKYSHYLILTNSDLVSDEHFSDINDIWKLEQQIEADQLQKTLKIKCRIIQNKKQFQVPKSFQLEPCKDLDDLQEDIQGLRKQLKKQKSLLQEQSLKKKEMLKEELKAQKNKKKKFTNECAFQDDDEDD